MSSIQVANIWFESTGNNRIQLNTSGANSYGFFAAGNNIFNVNSTAAFDAGGNIRSTPVNPQTAAYTLTPTDNGKIVSITTGGVTVNGATLSTGMIFTIFNNSGSSQTITSGTGATVYFAGTASTGNRTLAQRGLATVAMVGSNTFVISGAGLS